MNIAEKVETVLNERGWSHGRISGPHGEMCVLLASWTLTELTGGSYGSYGYANPRGRAWLNALAGAAQELFPDRLFEGDWQVQGILNPGGQVSDHPDTTREDISLLLKYAQERMDSSDE